MKKKVLITGATGSIGKIILKSFYDNGFEVFGIGRNLEKIEQLKKEFSKAKLIQADLTAFETAQKFLPDEIDILINCAGIYDYNDTEKADPKTVSDILNLNLEIPILLSKKYIPFMKEKKWGRIIMIGSISGAVGEAKATAYSASKAGLIGATKAMALELAEFGITVNCINPGWVDSDLTDNSLTEQEKSETLEMIPQKRFVEPKEVADLCFYLSSESAKGLTGQAINLCAGLSLG